MRTGLETTSFSLSCSSLSLSSLLYTHVPRTISCNQHINDPQGKKRDQRRALLRAQQYLRRPALEGPGYATHPVRPTYQRRQEDTSAILLGDPAVYLEYCGRQGEGSRPTPAILPLPAWSTARTGTTTAREESHNLPAHLDAPLGRFSPTPGPSDDRHREYPRGSTRTTSPRSPARFSYVSSVGTRSGPEYVPRILEGPWKPARIAFPRDKGPIRPRGIFFPPTTPVKPRSRKRERVENADDLDAIFEDLLDIPLLLSPIGSTPSPLARC